jgi:hypothetical protein
MARITGGGQKMKQPHVSRLGIINLFKLFQYPLFFVVVIVTFIVGIKYFDNLSPLPTQNIDKTSRIDDCVKKIKNDFDSEFESNFDLINAKSKYCYKEVYMQDVLWDFEVRRTSFAIQQYQASVLLTVVVMVTISGVALSALQLFAAFQLAMEGREKLSTGSELGIAAGKMSIKSSIAGVVILAISLLFFVIFVKYVFPIAETPSSGPSTETPPTSSVEEHSPDRKGRELSTGGFGRPPASGVAANRGQR